MSAPRCVLVCAAIDTILKRSLALGVLKANVEADSELARRIDIECLDFDAPTPDEIVAAVVSRAPTIVGFSCYVWNTALFFKVWRGVREALPNALIILGGPEVSPQPRQILERHPEVDVVVSGEGELTFPRLLRAALDGLPFDRIAGVTSRVGGAIVSVPEPPVIPDLEALPSPYLSGAMALDESDRAILLESSRGCPFDCKFCDWPARLQKPRAFSVDRMVRELEFAVAKAPNLSVIFLADSDIFIDKARAMSLLDGLLGVLEGTNITLQFDLYLGRFDEELIPLLGSRNLALVGGVQSIDPRTLKTVGRFFHQEKIASTMAAFRKLRHPPALALQTIFGLPGDTPEAMRTSIDWSLSLHPDMCMSSPALVLPGADMGLHPENYDMIFEADPPHRILSSSRYSRDDMKGADRTSFFLVVLGRLHVIRNSLYHLGTIVQERGMTILPLFEDFGRILIDARLLEFQGETEGERTNKGYAASIEILLDEPRLEKIILELQTFVRARLAKADRSDLLNEFEEYWRSDEADRRWLRLARDGSPALTAALDRALKGSRRILWVGRENLAEESALLRSREGDVETVHFFHSRWSTSASCAKARHILYAHDLKKRRGDLVDGAVLSHIYGRLEPAERASLLARLDETVKPGGRLTLFDDLSRESPFTFLGASAAAAARSIGAALTPEAIVREIEKGGWSLERPFEKTPDAYQFSAVKAR